MKTCQQPAPLDRVIFVCMGWILAASKEKQGEEEKGSAGKVSSRGSNRNLSSKHWESNEVTF